MHGRTNARARIACDQHTWSSGQRRRRQINPTTVYEYTIPLASLRALIASDASPVEIRRRLRLNLAIRILLDAIEAREVPL
jgi:hypothetical protein